MSSRNAAPLQRLTWQKYVGPASSTMADTASTTFMRTSVASLMSVLVSFAHTLCSHSIGLRVYALSRDGGSRSDTTHIDLHAVVPQSLQAALHTCLHETLTMRPP